MMVPIVNAEHRRATAEAKEEESLSTRPAWVVDHNLANLWSEGLDEDMIPDSDHVLTLKRKLGVQTL